MLVMENAWRKIYYLFEIIDQHTIIWYLGLVRSKEIILIGISIKHFLLDEAK